MGTVMGSVLKLAFSSLLKSLFGVLAVSAIGVLAVSAICLLLWGMWVMVRNIRKKRNRAERHNHFDLDYCCDSSDENAAEDPVRTGLGTDESGSDSWEWLELLDG